MTHLTQFGQEKHYKAIFCLVIVLVFMDTMLYGSIVPLIPVYTHMFHLTSLSMGAIFAAYALGLLLFSIPLGIVAERYGFKRVFIVGMGCLALCCGLFAFINSPIMLFWGRLMQGISGAATWTAGLSIVARMYPEQQGQKVGILMAAVGMGTISGPPIGGVLYELLGFHFMFIALSVICIALFIAVCRVHFGSLDVRRNEKYVKIDIRRVLSNSRLMWFSLIFTVICCSFGMLEVIMPNYMDTRFGMDSLKIGLFFGIMGICHACSDMLFGTLSDRYGFVPFIFWGMLGTALVVPFLALVPTVVLLGFIMFLFGITVGAAVTPGQPYMYQIVAEDPVLSETAGAGFAYGLMNTCFSLGMMLGPVIGGAVNKYFGFLPCLYGYAALIVIFAVIFYFKIMRFPVQKLQSD